MKKILFVLALLALSLYASVNINTATAEQLQNLQGIGEVKAERIVKYRQEHGNFQSVEELKEVKGIGQGTLAKLKEELEL